MWHKEKCRLGPVCWKLSLREHKKYFWGVNIFYILITMDVTWVCTFVKTHQIVNLKCLQFTVCPVYSNVIDMQFVD